MVSVNIRKIGSEKGKEAKEEAERERERERGGGGGGGGGRREMLCRKHVCCS